MNRHRWSGIALCLSMLVAAATSAQDISAPQKKSPEDLLSAIPADAWAAVCIPHAAKLDASLQSFTQRLNLPMPMGPPLAMMKGMLGFYSGFDDDGAMAVIVLPTQNIYAVGQSMAILIPTTDFNALIGGMSPEDLGDGIHKVILGGETSHAASYGKFGLFSKQIETVKRLMEPGKSLRSQITDHQARMLQQDSLTVWTNLGVFMSSPALEQSGLLQMIMAMQQGGAGAGGFDPESLKQCNQFQIGIRFEEAGLNIAGYVDARPDTDMHKSFSGMSSQTGTLLGSLPDGEFVFAMGHKSSAAQAQQAVEAFNNFMSTISMAHPEKKEALDAFKKPIGAIVAKARNGALSIAKLPNADHGMYGLAAVITVDGAAEDACSEFSSIVSVMKEELKDDAETGDFVNALSFKREAETVGSTAVHHITVAVPDDANDSAKALIGKLFGSEGIVLRLGAVRDDRVLLTLGGGKDYFATAMDAARSDDAPLAKAKSIQSLTQFKDRKRGAEAYIAVDRLVRMIGEMIPKEDQPMPFEIRDIESTVAVVSGPVGKAGSHSDIFIPMDAMLAVKDMIMNNMGMQMNAGDAPPPPQEQ